MKSVIIKTPTDKLRARFRRWLGQICKDARYTTLLDSSYSGWLLRTRDEQGFPLNPLKMEIDARSLKTYWENAIKRASFEQLHELDIILLNEKMDRR